MTRCSAQTLSSPRPWTAHRRRKDRCSCAAGQLRSEPSPPPRRSSSAPAAAVAAAAVEGAERAPRSTASARSPSCRARTPRTSSKASWTSGTSMHPDQKVTLIELPEDADAQRQQMIQNANAKSDAYTVLAVDNVWTAEFAANRYIVELPAGPVPQRRRVPPAGASTRRSTRTSSTRVPYASDGGLALLPHRPAAGRGHRRAAEDVARDDRRLQQDQGHAAGRGPQLLRRAVPEVRGPHGQRGRGDQQRGRRDHRQRRQAQRQHPRGQSGPRLPGQRLQAGLHPQGGPDLQGRGGPPRLPGGQADLPARNWPYMYALADKTDGSSQVAGQVRGGPAARPERPRRLQPRRPRARRSPPTRRTRRPRRTSSTSTPARRTTRRS